MQIVAYYILLIACFLYQNQFAVICFLLLQIFRYQSFFFSTFRWQISTFSCFSLLNTYINFLFIMHTIYEYVCIYIFMCVCKYLHIHVHLGMYIFPFFMVCSAGSHRKVIKIDLFPVVTFAVGSKRTAKLRPQYPKPTAGSLLRLLVWPSATLQAHFVHLATFLFCLYIFINEHICIYVYVSKVCPKVCFCVFPFAAFPPKNAI